MAGIQPDFDPWDDTTGSRGTERDNPLDSGHAGSPFGVQAEAAGIPNVTYQPRPTRPEDTPEATPRRARGARLVLLVLLVPALVAIANALWRFLG